MSDTYPKDTYVEWDWGNGTAKGQVQDHFKRDVERTLQGSKVTRNGTDDNPAYLIQQEDGDEVLKLHSEIRKAS